MTKNAEATIRRNLEELANGRPVSLDVAFYIMCVFNVVSLA
jgi:hypothetical protein